MIVDSSAVAAIVFEEPGWEELLRLLLDAVSRKMSAVTWLETTIVVDARSDPVLSRRLDELLLALDITVCDVTLSQAALARKAFHDFGKGRHHAGLSFGDCFSYALAAESREALLCKGNDFAHTDLEVVELSPSES